MLLPPSGRGREPVQGLAQQLERVPVLVPVLEPLGRQAQQPPPSRRWRHRIQAPQWLASSFHHASIAPMRLSKRNQ